MGEEMLANESDAGYVCVCKVGGWVGEQVGEVYGFVLGDLKKEGGWGRKGGD